ncbi:hypothetical protein ACVWXO_009424 [Bradyrhizobium sp. LM2.7]
MFSLFQADIACPRRQSFDRPLFETQTFSLLAAWHSRSNAEPAHIGPREQLSDIVRSLWPQPAASYEAQCLIGRHGCLEAVKCRRRNGGRKAR